MRSYGQKFLLELRDADPTRLGVQLGRLCVDANIPALYVSRVLKVSKTTIYAWFRGQYIREENRKAVEVFIDLVKKDMDGGVLPAKNSIDAKMYLESMVGGSI
mgnify:CR=1 FL=1|jgi:hypothetical protein